MIVTIDECVDCGLPCIFEACKYYKTDYVICDKCGEVIRAAYTEEYDSYDLCEGCAEDEVEG